MSLLFLCYFLAVVFGKVETTPEDFGIVWALFSIADALWFRRIL